MRYLLYESEQSEVRLDGELEFMNNYIELMKLRLSNKVELNVSFPGNTNGIVVPPLLFVPFIENAFKHGISYQDKSFIHISLHIDHGELVFECSNSIAKNGEEKVDAFSGIGLENIKKRLALLYPDNHELIINKSGSVFSVILNIHDKINLS
jgi:LytS/YehU family sensor histidine kinase